SHPAHEGGRALEEAAQRISSLEIFQTHLDVFLSSLSLLQTAVSVLQSSYLDSTSQDGFQYSQAILVENDVFLSELKAFAQAKEAAGYSQEELEETFAFLLFDNEEEMIHIIVCCFVFPGVYISKYADCLHPRPWYHGKSGYIVICKLIKYYVYEVSDGSAAERPRQICPYIIITCQYREPKEMPPFSLSPVALYCPWRGQLSIRGQRLCNIALRTPYSSTIPAQLPPNLDVNHVMGLSDLKKKLPEAAFGKRNYIENEVCFQGVYFSLYEVEISNKDQYKMDQLIENLKEKDLVSVLKYCRSGRNVAMFMPDEFILLSLLMIFPLHDPKDKKEDSGNSDISLKIASVLPGLRYALQKATSSSWGHVVSTSTRIKQHLQEYSKLDQNPQPASGQTSKVPLSSLFSPTEEECTNPFKKPSEQSFSQLRCYFSDPSSYTLEMSSALGCLTGAVQSLRCDSEADRKEDVSSAVPPDPLPSNTVAEGRLRRKKSKPAKQMHPVGDSGRNRKATKKKKINITFSFPKKPGLTASSNEPMLKLANLQFPHRRKRGAEVLSAEFVHKTQAEPVQKETSAPDDPSLQTKRAKTLKNSDVKKVPVAESVTKPVKSKMLKSVADSPSNPQAKKQAESGKSAVPCGNLSFRSRAIKRVADLGFDLKGNNYESHALNLLADLALGSCIPSFIPRDGRIIPVSCSPSSDSAKEQRSHRKHKSSRVASDHEYHRVDKVTKGTTSSSKGSLNQKLPPAEKIDLNDLASIPREKSLGIFSKKNSASPAKPPVLPPREAQEALEVNKHSFISAEHSYASQMPEHSKKHVYPRGSPYPGPAPSRNGTRNPRTGPLVGKVLPFRHQQNSTHPQRPFEAVAMRRRSSLLSPRLKENFAKSHTVNIYDKSLKVTCHWEAEYLFNLDSRYTNDALEKTVIRALHGPWDPDLPDDVEEMKLILHMWVALFYSKPSKLLSNKRKVVEHSNPEKYVSLNSTGDFLELSDDGEDCFGLETCPADSRSDPDQTPSSSLDHSTPCQGSFRPEESPADSQTDAAGTPGSHGVFLGAEKSPRSDKTNTAMVVNAPEEPEPSLRHLLQSEPSSSSVGEGTSATKEHPKEQQSSPDGLSLPAHTDLAPASPPKQDPLPCGGDTDTSHHLLEQSEPGPVPCQNGKPDQQVGAAEVATESPDGSLKPSCAEEVTKDTGPRCAEVAESSPRDVLVPGSPSLTPPSPPHNHKAGLHAIEPDSALATHPETCSPSVSLGGSPTSCYTGRAPLGACSRCASPGDMGGSLEEEPVPHEDSEGGSSVPLASPASFSEGESLTPPCEPPSACRREAEGSDTFADVHHGRAEVEEGEIPTLPFPMSPSGARRGISGESLELSDTEDISDALPRPKQLRGRDRRVESTSEGLFEFSSGDSDQEYFGGSADAADARTNCRSSSPSVVRTEGCGEDWGSLGMEGGSWAERGWGYVPPYVNIRDRQGIAKDYRNFVVTKKHPERMGNVQPWKRRSHRGGQSHLLRSLMGTWRGFEEITQRTLDMECLRFHYKLKQILRNRKPPFSTSKSIFPKDFAPRVTSETLPVREAPLPLSPRSRSPLKVTLLPSHTWPGGLGWHQPRGWCGDPCAPRRDDLRDNRSRARSRTGSQDHAAPFHLNKLRYDNKLKDSRGDIAVILDEYAELNRVRLSRADTGSGDRGTAPAPGEARNEWPRVSLPARMTAFQEMVADLCSTLRFRLRSVAEEACGRAGMFYLVETGEDPFFARVKALLKKDGRVEVEPLSFCEAKHPGANRLLVIIRNEDISSHIHNQVPCLLKLKCCPNVVFAGVDGPEDVTAHTYQELFHTGGFVVSDNEVLETVTLGQLKEVVKVLEKLNKSGRWKWLLHYKESKKLREDIRVDANARKKHLLLKSCQGAELVEVLHFHACDAASSPPSHSLSCLLNLQVQRVSARFAVYLTEKPGLSREVLESKGILVADVNTFLGTVQKVAAPFRRNYW
uniref:Transcription activation suppressor family member 2 n=1 Tax=Calidris pygmaea TaxID=425635 RepID=A0A8C3K686_9CHAR